MKIAFQNFLTTLKRYKTASILNIAGLTIAFIAFYILMAQVHYGLTYNSSIPDYERVYVTVTENRMLDFFQVGAPHPPTTEKAIEQMPEVESAGLIAFSTLDSNKYIYKKNGDNYDRYSFPSTIITIPVLEALGVELLVGDAQQLTRPATVIISDVAAKQMELGVGDYVYEATHQVGDYNELEIVGIYKAFPQNTLLAEAHVLKRFPSINSMFYYGMAGVVKLREDADAEKFENLWRDIYYENLEAEVGEGVVVEEKPMHLVSLKDIYFSPFELKPDGNFLGLKQGNRSTIYSQIAVAILTVLIAFINFVNFFFALIPVRIRAVNISKVFGATNRSLRWSFLFEALALTLISLGLALYLMIAIQDSFIADFVDCSLALKDNLVTIGWILLIVVALALTAALYPAWYITSFAPSLAIKGRFGGSKAGQRLRIVLSFVQFTISMTLIMVTLAFWLQYRYMTSYDMGFDYENVITFSRLPYDIDGDNIGNVLIEEFKRIPSVEDITMCTKSIFSPTSRMQWEDVDKKILETSGMEVRYNFLNFFRIPVQGRDFTEQDDNEHIISAEIKSRMGNENWGFVNRTIGTISGCRFRSLNRPDVYYYLTCQNDTRYLGYFYIRLHPSSDYKQAIEQIKIVWDKVAGGGSDLLQIEKVEDQIADMYAETRNQTVILSMFSFASIIISLMGVFGIVIFETQYRRKEIAIRRVFGATTSGLLWMFNSRYVQIVVACFMMATPIAYYIIHEWQKDFAHKTHIGWWVYLSALAMVMLLTLALVTHRSLKAARENPADVVKGD